MTAHFKPAFAVAALLLLAPAVADAQSARWEIAGGVLAAGTENTLRLVFEDCEPDFRKLVPPKVAGLEWGKPRIIAAQPDMPSDNASGGLAQVKTFRCEFSVRVDAPVGAVLTLPAFETPASGETVIVPAVTFIVEIAKAPKPAPPPTTPATPAPPATKKAAPTPPPAPTKNSVAPPPATPPPAPSPLSPPRPPPPTPAPAEIPPPPAPTPPTPTPTPPAPTPPPAPPPPAPTTAVPPAANHTQTLLMAGSVLAFFGVLTFALFRFAAHLRNPRRAAKRRLRETLRKLKTLGNSAASDARLRMLLREWQCAVAAAHGLDAAAPDARKLPDVRWYSLWREAENILSRRATTLGADWISKAREALSKL